MRKNILLNWAFGLLATICGLTLWVSLIVQGFDISPIMDGPKELIVWGMLLVLGLSIFISGMLFLKHRHDDKFSKKPTL